MDNNNKNIRKKVNARFFEIVDELSSPRIYVIKSILELCNKIGLKRGALYAARNEKRHIPLLTVEKFLKKYPFVSRNYIYEGTAPKYIKKIPVVKKPLSKSSKSQMAQIRKRFNLSQRDMCSMLGVTQALISHYENGVANIPDKIKIKLHARLNVSYAFLVENKGEIVDNTQPLAPEQITHLQDLRHQVYQDNINEVDHSLMNKRNSFNTVHA